MTTTTTMMQQDNLIVNLMICLTNHNPRFVYGLLEKLYMACQQHRHYTEITLDPVVSAAWQACDDRVENGPGAIDDDTLLDNYQEALMKFIFSKGFSYHFNETTKLAISKDTGSYYLGNLTQGYSATVTHYTMTFLSWERSGMEEVNSFGWFSNQSEVFFPTSEMQVLEAFITRKESEQPHCAGRYGVSLEAIHKEEIRTRAATEWELQ